MHDMPVSGCTFLHDPAASSTSPVPVGTITRMDRKRLANAVIARRVQLGHRSREAFAEAAGISPRTISYIETGEDRRYNASTVAQLEHALKWAPGSVARILAGGDPMPLPDSARPIPPLAAELAAMLDPDSPLTPEARDYLGRLVDLAMTPHRQAMRRRDN
jgi:transcriptional regulator with XRE-family HTH domain